MKVLMVNGSPHKNGCTYTALCEIAILLTKKGFIQWEYLAEIWLIYCAVLKRQKKQALNLPSRKHLYLQTLYDRKK